MCLVIIIQQILQSTTYEGCLPLNLNVIRPLHPTTILQETWGGEKQAKWHEKKKSHKSKMCNILWAIHFFFKLIWKKQILDCFRTKDQRDITTKCNAYNLNIYWFKRSYKKHFLDSWSNLNIGWIIDAIRELLWCW